MAAKHKTNRQQKQNKKSEAHTPCKQIQPLSMVRESVESVR